MFITFEGLDSSGKSTQIQLLSDKLKSLLKEIILIREPGGTKVSEKIRGILLDKNNSTLDGETEFLLFASSRAQLVREIILPALENNKIVLCDRFTDSSVAYQGFGRGLNLKMINEINSFATDNLNPDLTFFIDIPVEEISKRRELDLKENDRIESVGIDFYKKVRSGYLNLAKEHKNRFFVIDGLLSVENIHNTIWEKVSAKL